VRSALGAPGTLGRLARMLLGGAGLGALGYGLTLLYRTGTPLAVCLGAGVLLALALALVRGLPVDPSANDDERPTRQPPRPQRASFGDLHTLELRLRASEGDQDRFDQRVRPYCAAIAVELLRQRHGLDWPVDRDRVEAVAGAGVWLLLTTPPGAIPASRARLATWIRELEELAAGAGPAGLPPT